MNDDDDDDAKTLLDMRNLLDGLDYEERRVARRGIALIERLKAELAEAKSARKCSCSHCVICGEPNGDADG